MQKTTDKSLLLYGLAINYAIGFKTRTDALDRITEEREKMGKSPKTKEAGAFFDAVWDISETKAKTKDKTDKFWRLASDYAKRI